jgi:hypothetical protein
MITPTLCRRARFASARGGEAEAAGRLDDHLHSLGEEAHRLHQSASLAVSTSSTSRRMISKVIRPSDWSARRRRSSSAPRYAPARPVRIPSAGVVVPPRARHRDPALRAQGARAASAEPESKTTPREADEESVERAGFLEQLLAAVPWPALTSVCREAGI